MDTLLQLMESYGYIAMFFAMAAENANIPIPSEVILGFAGFLISQGVFEFMPPFIIACLAGIFGSVVSYFLGLYGGRPLLLKYGKYIFFNEKKFRLTERLFDSYGGIAVLVCRCLPGVRTFISFPAGMARYPMWHFFIWTALGTFPWTLLLVYLGKVLGENWKDLIQYNHAFLLVVMVIFAIVAVVLGFKFYKNRRKS